MDYLHFNRAHHPRFHFHLHSNSTTILKNSWMHLPFPPFFINQIKCSNHQPKFKKRKKAKLAHVHPQTPQIGKEFKSISRHFLSAKSETLQPSLKPNFLKEKKKQKGELTHQSLLEQKISYTKSITCSQKLMEKNFCNHTHAPIEAIFRSNRSRTGAAILD